MNLSGSFTNAEWPAEWWGAKSDGSDAAPAINRALQQIANTGKQCTLLLADRYEVRDTIYMQPGVAISGVSGTYSYGFYPKNLQGQISNRPARGTLVVDLVDSVRDNVLVHGYEKWVIDTEYEVGVKIPYNKLYISDEDGFSQRIFSKYNGSF